ncbi:KilA-N domain-containing protein [Pseudomonas sp. MWU12-2037]|uniref:KilA-N domain-containing protein n=1 Tax=Pseudomonas sp. MWU12-2037 TaxID=2928690 RepID=UPI00200CC74D|nr:KilA-N domain-containing protein [Pseudomonas sp. MWU12-2037]
MTLKIISLDYSGHTVSFNAEGWLNATNASSHFGKDPAQWLELDSTKEYITRISERISADSIGQPNTRPVWTRRGKNSSREVWLHPKLAVKFACWLSVDFEIWCDEQLEGLVLNEMSARVVARRQAAISYRSMCDALFITHEAIGKTTKPHHYMNEARLINEVVTGAFAGRDRTQLTLAELELVTLIENRDVLLLGLGKEYGARKVALNAYMEQLRTNKVRRIQQ